MKKTTFKTEHSFQISMTLHALKIVAPVVSSWVEKNGPLHKSGVFFDFAKSALFVRKGLDADDSFAGQISIPFSYSAAAKHIEQISQYVLVAPLHKMMKVLQYAEASNTDFIFEFTQSGHVYLKGGNNTIQLNVEWYDQLDTNESPFAEYASSPIGYIEELYSKRASLTHEALLTAAEARNALEEDMNVGRIDGTLRYVEASEMPAELHVGVADTPVIRTINTARQYALSYARMSLFLCPITEDSSLPSRIGMFASDRSVPTPFLKDVQALVRAMISSTKAEAVAIGTATTALSNDDVLTVLKIEANEAVAYLTIPSATTLGMAPPSSDDLNAILPELAEESTTALLTINHSDLKRTLAFWDSLQRVDGKDIVTPLKPITFEFRNDGARRCIELSVNSADGVNTALYDVVAELNGEAFEGVRVPFDTLMSILSSPLLEDESDPYITISRPRTEDAAVILIHKNNCIAAIAEFV